MEQRADAGDLWSDDGTPRHQWLELAAGQALAAGDLDGAFAFADERCRMRPAPEAHAFVLRAEASWRKGDERSAIEDLDTAVAITPEDVEANRRLLAWTSGKRQQRAAAALIANDRDTTHLANAIALLRRHRRNRFASVTVLDDAVRGWAVWPAGGGIALTIAGDREVVTVAPAADPFHPLATRTLAAAAFRVPRPRTTEPQIVDLADDAGVFFSTQATPNEARPVASANLSPPQDGTVTVIVPVYADYPATRRCLDILVRELDANPQHRAVIINDAAPDKRMAPYLATVAERPSVTPLTNSRNLGFVAATNRGYAVSGRTDVLLLNADTIPPAGFIDRLARAAESAPDIGIVVPLSNNAEFTSFPVANVANAVSGPDEATRLDVVAARVNAGRVIDIPAGTGFCLYIRRRCLDALGGLLEGFHRGYLEDVDLCLRAREHGFRVVCDPSVYVGHVGSRSFGDEKASLVVRNFRVLRDRYPDYPAECKAFAAADPLLPARSAIIAAETAARR